ncbi:enoyl-CoA hydratase/isomerase family protein [uncultured Phenylobacterium sp.]|uniref:enoyl-CoA hydratase/isomerase family protein n=1 Tax=uncultured Phenylobacterium sp. TaxID=349273 RepID=UPI0025E7FD59|nr:enoyl-CoA hydratase/isomerase family protein [uncultured Phenylobacterium sp.]
MSFQTVLYEAAGGIARITLNRPEKHNALNHQMMDDLDAAFIKAGGDDSVSVVILAGAGPSFCSGYDLKGGSYYITPPGEDGRWQVDTAMGALADIEQRYLRIWNCPKVTIARVQGNALAAGCYLQLLCDISVAADTARLGHPAAGVGSSSMPLWQFAMPLKKARYLLLTRRIIDGATAERFDLVTMAVPEAELDSTVEGIAADALTLGPVDARYKKSVYNAALDIHGLGAAFRYHSQMNAMARLANRPT